MSSKRGVKAKSAARVPHRLRVGAAPGALVSVMGGTVRISSVKGDAAADVQNPLSDIVRRIKQDPSYGAKLAYEAGITTKTGRLTKSYS